MPFTLRAGSSWRLFVSFSVIFVVRSGIRRLSKDVAHEIRGDRFPGDTKRQPGSWEGDYNPIKGN
ncbi:hypothetical protein ROR02_25460 [Pararhodospirillum oryzae]|uniref:Uncharacterized protein n=1 Tax=Pararhodospirillum oryzae TaxID=478448 RepID=A0A512HAE7_9PROT|nr:hypothetical protein ROR02_25460 [Pararhodospirillum oryzae]